MYIHRKKGQGAKGKLKVKTFDAPAYLPNKLSRENKIHLH